MDELECLENIPTCTCNKCICGNGIRLDQYSHNIKLNQFLMGLSEQYNSTRGQILVMKPMPYLNQAYDMLLQEENQRDTNIHKVQPGENMAMMVKHYYGNKQKNSKFTNRSDDSSSQECDYCHGSGHTRGKGFLFTWIPNPMGSLNLNLEAHMAPMVTVSKQTSKGVWLIW